MIPYPYESYELLELMQRHFGLHKSMARYPGPHGIEWGELLIFLNKVVEITDDLKPYRLDYNGPKKPIKNPFTINTHKKTLDDLWKKTFEVSIRKKATSAERSIKPLHSDRDVLIALHFHWFLSQLTVFCGASDVPKEQEGFQGIPTLPFIPGLIKKLKKTINNRRERIDKALRGKSSLRPFDIRDVPQEKHKPLRKLLAPFESGEISCPKNNGARKLIWTLDNLSCMDAADPMNWHRVGLSYQEFRALSPCFLQAELITPVACQAQALFYYFSEYMEAVDNPGHFLQNHTELPDFDIFGFPNTYLDGAPTVAVTSAIFLATHGGGWATSDGVTSDEATSDDVTNDAAKKCP